MPVFSPDEEAFVRWLVWKSGAYEDRPAPALAHCMLYEFALRGPAAKHEVVVFRPSEEALYPLSAARQGDLKVGRALDVTDKDGFTRVLLSVPFRD